LILIRSNGPQDEKTGRGPRIQKTKGRPYGPAGFGIIPAITTKPNMVSLKKKKKNYIYLETKVEMETETPNTIAC